MVDTIEIGYTLPVESFISLTPDIYNIKKLNHNRLDKFLKNQCNYLAIPSLPAGINHMKFVRNKEFPNTMYLKMTLDLQALIYGSATTDLFDPKNILDVFILCSAYAEAVLKVFPSLREQNIDISRYIDNDIMATNTSLEALPYLMLAKTTVIDYAFNLVVPEEEKQLTLKQVKHSYYDTRKKTRDFKKHKDGTKNYNLFAVSASKKPTNVTKLYDKYRYFTDKKIPVPIGEEETAKKILRFEYRRANGLDNFVINNYNPPASYPNLYLLSPVIFFDSDICHKILMSVYEKEIGIQNWYADYQFEKIITQSNISKHKKSIIRAEIAPIISQTRSIQKALPAYVKGYKLKTGKKIKGSAATFKSYLNEIRSLNTQPLRVPDRAKENYIMNPINSIQQQKRKIKQKYDVLPHIEMNIAALLRHLWLKSLKRPLY